MPAVVFCEHCGGIVQSVRTIPSLAKRCTCGQAPGSHPAEQTVIAKVCCACGRDVTHQPRMKDTDGKYWCIPCGESDRAEQHHEHQNCADCQMRWPLEKIKLLEGLHFCEGCYLSRMRSRENLQRAFARRKWWSMGLGIGLGAAAVIAAICLIIHLTGHPV